MAMVKKLGFIVILSMCLVIVDFSSAQEESPSPAISPGHETPADSPLPPSSSPKSESSPSPVSSPRADSLPPPASSPKPESLANSPLPSPSRPPQPESQSPSPSSSSLSPVPASVPAPSDYDESDEDSEPETEYFPSPVPAPAPEEGKPEDIKASDEGDEFNDERGEEDSGMSGLKKAGITIGAILGVGAIVIGALVYKKRRDNLTRARYTYFEQSDFL